jgi:hypothetical protein
MSDDPVRERRAKARRTAVILGIIVVVIFIYTMVRGV